MDTNFKYQDFIDEQQYGNIHGVFIDDTGSPGLQNTPPHLHPSRKSWVAVFVPKTQLVNVWSQLPGAIAELKSMTGAQEFHFCDIYAGRNEFKGVPRNTRLAIFQFMAYIFGTYRFPIFVQTLDPSKLEEIQNRVQLPHKLGPFNLQKHEDLALAFLLFRIKWYLENNFTGIDKCAQIFVDEGYKKNGAAIHIPQLESVFSDGLVCFARSDTIIPIQLADFAAFCLNRTQLLIGRTDLSEWDIQFLKIIEPLAWNHQNIPKIPLADLFPKNDPNQN